MIDVASKTPFSSMSFAVVSGVLTIALLSALFVVKKELKRRKSQPEEEVETNFVDRIKYPGGRITIFFATQTGTAESFSNQLEREGAEHGFLISEVDMENVESVRDFIAEDYIDDETGTVRVIVIASTYGEGDPTDSSLHLVESIKELLAEGNEDDKHMLRELEFCVFGLGNTQYEHYNAIGKFFDTALEALGGTRIKPIGLGDDDKDLEGDFETWKDQLWVELKSKYLQNGGADFQAPKMEQQLPECEYIIEYHDKTKGLRPPPRNRAVDEVHASCRHYFTSVDCPVLVNRELRSPEDDGSTVHIEIDISDAKSEGKLSYQTADNLGVLPLNSMAVVESVAESLGYDLDAVFSLQDAPNHHAGAPFPMPITIRECLLRYCDLTSAPRRSDLKLLALYAQDSVDKKFLARLSSKEGKKEYKEKIMEGYIGIVDLLKSCPSLKIPLEHFITVCHHQLPRSYTISSSSSAFPDSIHLTVSVTEETKPDGSKFAGVCSTYLAGLKPGIDTVRVFNRPSTFRLPSKSSRPILLIGPGTGIAPMRALLYERKYQRETLKQTVGPNILYFGCKNRSLDYLYEDELMTFKNEGVLNELHLAFSREQSEKVYVQHLLANNATNTWKLISEQMASIYVCGGAKMGHDVMEALKGIVSTKGEMSFDDAKDYLAKLSSEGRFVQELWA